MNEDWLAEPVCWGFGSVYRVALMSGGSRRLWNQLLRGTPSFVLSSFFNPLSHSWLSAFVRFLPFSLYISRFLSLILSTSIPLRVGRGRERFIPYKKKLHEQNHEGPIPRKVSGVRAQVHPCIWRIPLLSFHNLRQLPPTTGGTAEIEL